MALSKATRDHEEIRTWAEARHAVPVEVSGAERKDETGFLRFEFPDAPNRNGKDLQEISWDELFAKFDVEPSYCGQPAGIPAVQRPSSRQKFTIMP